RILGPGTPLNFLFWALGPPCTPLSSTNSSFPAPSFPSIPSSPICGVGLGSMGLQVAGMRLCGSPSDSGAPQSWNGALWGWDTIPWVSVDTIPPGLHTRLRVSGCDLLSDGSIRGSHMDGYDGRDFISFDLESGRFVPADSAAEITRRRWEKEEVAERRTNYLKHVCPEWLRKYVGYREKELERKEPPDVHVSGKEEHGTLILSCHAYGFYPKTIAVSWMKGDETLDQETERGGIVPNSDGTFHTWARIEALPEEREQYRCRVEHPGMPEPGIFAWGNLLTAKAEQGDGTVSQFFPAFLVIRKAVLKKDSKGQPAQVSPPAAPPIPSAPELR
uniref:Ig-like domain-containing protein n=1 Tax=Serinus canaria TaxID=9135 RepID=A0A8C9NJG8_SERCA